MNDLPFAQVVHQVRRYQIASTIEACFALLRIQLLQAAPNRHIWASDKHYLGKPGISPVRRLVQNAPCRQHPHYRRLAATGGHFAGISDEAGVTFLLCLAGRLVAWGGETLTQVSPGLGQEDHRLGGLPLTEEQPAVALAFRPRPVAE